MAKQERRVALNGSTRKALPGKDAGPAYLNQQIEVTVFLRRGSSGSTSAAFPPVEQMSAQLPRERKYSELGRICAHLWSVG